MNDNAPERIAPGPTNLNENNSSQEEYVWVLDPVTRKLRVPVGSIVPTQATASAGTVPSLCMLYLEGKCRHPWCRQAHIPADVVARLRNEALASPTCCVMHRDPHDISALTALCTHIRLTGTGMVIPCNRVAMTTGLQRFLAQQQSGAKRADGATLDIPPKLICRLHLSNKCRYLEDCNNVHLCRELDLPLAPHPQQVQTLQGITAASANRTITVGETSFTVQTLATGLVTDAQMAGIVASQRQSQEGNVSAPADVNVNVSTRVAVRMYDVRTSQQVAGVATTARVGTPAVRLPTAAVVQPALPSVVVLAQSNGMLPATGQPATLLRRFLSTVSIPRFVGV